MSIKKKIFFIIILSIFIICIYLFYRNFTKESFIQTYNDEITNEAITEPKDMTEDTIDTINNVEDTNESESTEIINENDNMIQINVNDNLIQESSNYIPPLTSIFDENAFVNNHLKSYPSFGKQYATLKIDKIGINAPIFFGLNDEIILQGIGHDTGSYLPGENGSIIMCEHNYMNNFSRLGELQNRDIIEIKTNYGDFYYQIYDSKIVLETETDKLPIQYDHESLMIYTCYPFNNSEYTNQRYVIYAKKI